MVAANRTMTALIIFLAVNLAGTGSAGGEILPVYEFHFATRTGERYIRSRDNEFGCDDTIYMFLESSDQTLESRSLDATWRNLESGERHQTSKPFKRKSSGTRFWSWSGVAFRSGDTGPFGAVMGFLDPVAGREKFIGEWEVVISVPGNYTRTARIRVLC